MKPSSIHEVQYITNHIKTKYIGNCTCQIKVKAYKYQKLPKEYINQLKTENGIICIIYIHKLDDISNKLFDISYITNENHTLHLEQI